MTGKRERRARTHAGREGGPSDADKSGLERRNAAGAGDALETGRAAVDRFSLIDAIADGIVLIDTTGRIVAVNQALEKLLGETRATLVGKTVRQQVGEHLSGHFADEALQLWNEITTKGEVWTQSLVFTDTRGRAVPITCRASRVDCEVSGGPLVVVTVRDLSELHEFRSALSRSEERYRTLFDSSLELIYEHDLQRIGRFIDLNDRALDLLGYERADIASLTVPDVIDPSDMPRADRNMANLLKTGRDSRTHEFRLRGKDGRRVWVELSGTLIVRDGKPRAVLGVARDITDRKRAEEALVASEERFRELVELLPEIVCEVDTTGKITFANRRGFELTGYSREQFEKGLYVQDLIAPEDRKRLLENVDRLLAGKKTRNSEYRALKKDGTTFPVIVNTVPIFKEGEIAGLRGIVFDLSERRQMEESLLQSQKIEAIGTLAGGIAHDINNVLASISSLATLLKEESRPDASRLADIDEILSMTARGGEFARNLLGYARRGKYRTERVSLNKMAEQVLKIIERTVSKKITLRTELDPGLSEVEGDPGQLSQVLMNLCLNAADAVRDTGTVTVSTRDVRHQDLPGSLSSRLSPGRHVELRMRDDGVGMDEEIRKRAFEPFFTTKEPGKGTGLGLAMVYGVVRNHRGDVRVESEPGAGTTIVLLFPALAPAEAQVEGKRAPLPIGKGGTGTVLLVDDEAVLRSTGKRLLARLGYRVLLAGDGAAALETFKRFAGEIDLVLLDLGMPIMDGAECFRKLKALKPDVRVLVSSGYSDSEKVDALMADGVLGFLHKPFSVEHLNRAVSRALGVLPPDPPGRS